MNLKEITIKTVSTFTTAAEAHIVKGRLEAEGIPAYVGDEHLINANWTMSLAIGGVRLQVPTSFESEAKKIISELNEGSYDDEMTTEWSESQKIQCPNCHSVNTNQVNRFWKFAFIGMFLVSIPIPFPFSRYQYKCDNCAHSWIAKDQRNYSPLFIFMVTILFTAIIMSVFYLFVLVLK